MLVVIQLSNGDTFGVEIPEDTHILGWWIDPDDEIEQASETVAAGMH